MNDHYGLIPEPITPAEFLDQLTARLAETEEPYDAEAGLNKLFQRIEAQRLDDTTAPGAGVSEALERVMPTELIPPESEVAHRRDVPTPVAYLHPDIVQRALDLNERRLELEERQLEQRRAARKMASADLQAKLTARNEGRAQVGRLLLQTGGLIAVTVGYAFSIINQATFAIFALSGLLALYGLAFLLIVFTAVRSNNEVKRHDARELLRLLFPAGLLDARAPHRRARNTRH